MRTIFFGTPAWAVPSLDALVAAGIDVAGVVTNPDQPAGRGLALKPSPVKARAVALAIPLHQPARAKDPALEAWLADQAVDVAVVVAYGKLLPGALLALPPKGFVNVHFSLLPEYRGAAPVQRAVIDGRTETGVSIMVLTEGMDEGPIVTTQPVPIEPGESAGALGERLAKIGASILPAALQAYVAGVIEPTEQDHDAATYAPKITDAEARIDWSAPRNAISNLVRGCDPNPGAWTTFRSRRVKVFALETGESGETGEERDEAAGAPSLGPGELLPGPRLVVGTGSGAAVVAEAQPAGRRRMSGDELARGLRVASGERFE